MATRTDRHLDVRRPAKHPHLAELVRDLQRQNIELAGMVGSL